ncbi:MAG: exonuclease domain-containing protein [Clostridiaceae bacterium]|nr:exonuclease domain-containing protein [Clostridiaceae bacterium]
MNYLIFDLEFNQHYSAIKEDKNIASLSCPFEIIQIGAVKLDLNLNTISNFDFLVKPEIYLEIHPYVKDITGLTMESLKDAPPFKEVYKDLYNFIDDDNCIFCVWGMSDIKELFRNIQYHQLDTSKVPTEYIDLQSNISKYFNCPKGTHIGLRNAVELLELPIKAQFHNALNDAFYTAEIFKKTYNEDFKTSIYNPESYKQKPRQQSEKYLVDLVGLFLQFEKMYNRKMSIEEKEIIKLAYFMGKTNQFII